MIALLDAFSGISGDMTLGALIEVGLDPDWLRALPARLGLDGISVRVQPVKRAGIACTKVDFDIPPQPHGRHIHQIRDLVANAGVPESVRAKADAVFLAVASCEAEIHGVPIERVHLHEVGAVDAILDVVGAVWGFELLGVERIYCGPIHLGDGTVVAAHGVLPVPAPATLKLLEGHPVRPGPENSGELVTPTGAALVRVLSSGRPPAEYTPRRSGFGAGTKDPKGRANALRITLADVPVSSGLVVEHLVQLACDIDDMEGEYVAAVTEALRDQGALDVVLLATNMKKGRPGIRLEVLCSPADADALEGTIFAQTSTIGVRRAWLERHALPRQLVVIRVGEQPVRVKIVTMPDGRRRAKAEFDDVRRLADVSGVTLREALFRATSAAERLIHQRVPESASGALAHASQPQGDSQ
ncbi:MAG: nickel pincer cofactor biosynthesis protein LarC [Gemmatimonadota bacterium]|nr:nickel pincer cofactor biosynthesis protein LarC [Gemmatimonadota bacterium]